MNACGSCMSSHPEVKSLLAGTRSLFGSSVPLHLAHWRTGTAVPVSQCRRAGSMDSSPGIDIPSASVAAAHAALQNQKRYDGKPV